MSSTLVKYNQIDETQDTNDPVMRATLNESRMTFIIDTEAKCVNVWNIRSESKGEMKMMMDHLMSSIKYDWVKFIAPLDDSTKKEANRLYSKMGVEDKIGYDVGEEGTNITEALDGFEYVEEQHGNQEVPMLVGFWELDR
jgi:hypothetical protein